MSKEYELACQYDRLRDALALSHAERDKARAECVQAKGARESTRETLIAVQDELREAETANTELQRRLVASETNRDAPVEDLRKLWVAVIVRDDRGHILVEMRPPNALDGGKFGPPGGKVQSGETFTQAAVRELAEETGGILVGPSVIGYVNTDPRGLVILVTGTVTDRAVGRIGPGWAYRDPGQFSLGDTQGGLVAFARGDYTRWPADDGDELIAIRAALRDCADVDPALSKYHAYSAAEWDELSAIFDEFCVTCPSELRTSLADERAAELRKRTRLQNQIGKLKARVRRSYDLLLDTLDPTR